MRLIAPVAIDFQRGDRACRARPRVNLASAWLLFDRDDHHHGARRMTSTMTTTAHDHHHVDDHDNNIRAAYVHVLADALTSVLAIVALTCGLLFGRVWMDPLMALVGVAVILSWSFGLIRAAGAVLLDMVPDRHLAGTHPQAAGSRRRPGQRPASVAARARPYRPDRGGGVRPPAGAGGLQAPARRALPACRMSRSRCMPARTTSARRRKRLRGQTGLCYTRRSFLEVLMSVDAETVRRIAHLARIAVAETRSSICRASSTPSSPSSSNCRRSMSRASSR